MWIADMAASMQFTNEEAGLYNVKSMKELIKISSGENIYATNFGKLDISFQENRCQATFMLENVCYILSFYIKVFCLMVAMSRGCKIMSKNSMIIVRKDALKLRFDGRQSKRNTSVRKCLDTEEMAKDLTNDKMDSV